MGRWGRSNVSFDLAAERVFPSRAVPAQVYAWRALGVAKLHPIVADDESDFTYFQVFSDDKVVNVSIACELVDRIAGERLGQSRRIQFLRSESDLFSSAAVRKVSALGAADSIMLEESDFPNCCSRWGSA